MFLIVFFRNIKKNYLYNGEKKEERAGKNANRGTLGIYSVLNNVRAFDQIFGRNFVWERKHGD